MAEATIADIRAEAASAAATMPGNFVGVTQMPDGQWALPTFDTRSELDDWYGKLTDDPTSFKYAAAFDKTTASTEAVNESFGSGKAIDVRVTSKAAVGPLAALGAVAMFGAATVYARRGKRRK